MRAVAASRSTLLIVLSLLGAGLIAKAASDAKFGVYDQVAVGAVGEQLVSAGSRAAMSASPAVATTARKRKLHYAFAPVPKMML